MNSILFSFLEISPQNFDIVISRKKSNEKVDAKGYYLAKLPDPFQNNDEDQVWSNYIVCLNEIEGYERYNLNSLENEYLTNNILFDSLILSLDKNEISYEVENETKYQKIIEICLSAYPSGNQVATLQPYFLKSEKKFGFLINFKFKQNKDSIFDKEIQRLSLSLDSNYRSNKDYYRNKYQFISKIFGTLPLIEIGNQKIEIDKQLYEIQANQLAKKNYLFKNNNESDSQFNGIKKFGPYKEIEHIGIQFYFIFCERHKNLANDIYLSLIGKKNPGTFPGLQSMFNITIEKENVSSIILKEFSVDEANNAIKELDSRILLDNVKKPFVIYIEENNHEEQQQQLYNYFKFQLLKREIAFQVVTNEKLGNQDTLKWSVSSIGLQIFSKLGGIPWLVKPSKDNCLILGIGQAYGKSDENGKIIKQFAYSVCIDSTGLFKKVALLSNETSDRDDFLNSISENLKLLLESDDFKDYKKCAIHIPFKVKGEVIEAIRNTAKTISQNMDLKIIKVNTKNKFFGYSNHLTKVPYESSFIKLAKGEFLVWFEGLNYGKEIVYKRPANPVHIEFLNYEGSDHHNEMEYLQDILNLSGGNWRGFNAKAMPISIYYSQIIADYTLDFEELDDFSKDVFITNKPWFL